MSRAYVTTGEAARAIGVGHQTLLDWAHSGMVEPAFRTPGGQYRWDVADLLRQLGARPPAPQGAAVPQSPTQPEPVHDPAAPLKPAIATAIVTSNRGVLLERRHDGRPLWTFPAGEIEPGEAPVDTAIRETKEECGLAIKVSHIIGERDHPMTGRHMIYLACRPYQGTAVHVGDEAELAEVKWVSTGQAVELMPTMFGPVHDHLARVLPKS